jgi:hypothetical protein
MLRSPAVAITFRLPTAMLQPIVQRALDLGCSRSKVLADAIAKTFGHKYKAIGSLEHRVAKLEERLLQLTTGHCHGDR